MDILDWIEKAKRFNSNEFLNDFANDIYSDHKIDDIQKDQWEKGFSSKDREIGFYKKTTEEITGGRKKYGELYNLKDSGDFWDKTYLITKVTRGNDIVFEFSSKGVNKRKLFSTIRKFGLIENPEEIFGISETYMPLFIKRIEPKFINLLKFYYNV